jgi:hypothetical protein
MFGAEGEMIRTIVEEAIALVTVALFVGMIAVWAGVLSGVVTADRRRRPRTCA